MTANPQHLPLSYDAPLGVGQLRTHRPDGQTLIIFVGPPPLRMQLISIAPIAVMVGIFSIWLGALLWSLLIDAFLPLDHWLLLPALIAWGFCSFELAMQFRQWGQPSRFRVTAEMFSFPYPLPRSRLEELPAQQIIGLRVGGDRARIGKGTVHSLEVELARGARFQLLRGYPERMLEEMCQILAQELGLEREE